MKTIKRSMHRKNKIKKNPIPNYYIAVDLGGTNIRTAVVDEHGQILDRLQILTLAHQGAEQVLIRIKKLIYQLLKQTKTIYRIAAIGIGSPGCIDVMQGTVLFATNNLPGWKGTNLRAALETGFAIPVFVDNDANTAAYGEKFCGAGKTVSNFIAITIGTGVGGGIIINNEVYRGHNFYGGEIGHMTICYNGPKCNCGNFGCLEAYISASALVDFSIRMIQTNPKTKLGTMLAKNRNRLTPETIYHAALQGDIVAKKIITEAGYHLGIGLSNLINLFSPEMIAIGGGIAQSGTLLFTPARKEIRNRALFINERSIPIVPTKLGVDAGLIGAGLLAKQYYQSLK